MPSLLLLVMRNQAVESLQRLLRIEGSKVNLAPCGESGRFRPYGRSPPRGSGWSGSHHRAATEAARTRIHGKAPGRSLPVWNARAAWA